MERPILYIAITNHGFGHASRMASVAATIQKLCPEVLLIMVTTAPRWLLECYIEGDFIHRPRAFDLGVIQADSLTMDKAATLDKLREIKQKQNSLVASEVNFIRQNRVHLILADIPFLASVIAKAANIPCWSMSNFGWDFIYRDWGGEFLEIADWISECYSKCDRLYRLPFHEPMSAFSNIIDVGLTGGSPRYAADDLRSIWGIAAPVEKTILLTFGGLGVQQLPYDNLRFFPDWQFIVFDQSAPDLPNVVKITDRKYRPVDFMPICGRVVSKPGYGTFAEAIKLEVPIATVTREGFAEAAFLVEGLINYHPHQILTPSEFFQGTWDFLYQPLLQPKLSQPIAKDGNEAIANAVMQYFSMS
ncbi:MULTISPECIES: glycosyl transferase [unclassified Tolypothrix]|uniref:glycosyl transferase n=1 Tax=unclassified Tolypothrix TaxID=2649714 RepID=UPI0005F7D8E8|nr:MULTISPECIES: glycosyl transferase [unclassified Tolypothrix]MBE9086514.1 glycosyl transferase [Tolypothrix sp. LEGE 11397]UYD29527.1 glycosyl transferase [Tolypothrix sp. PCC 7712]UYD37561.1 glycosyl transferase [Tolypothrix sp. PCC 7601]